MEEMDIQDIRARARPGYLRSVDYDTPYDAQQAHEEYIARLESDEDLSEIRSH